MEQWKNIIGYEGYYQISSAGRVKSIKRKTWNGKVQHIHKEIILKLFNRKDGYVSCVLCKDCKKNTFLVHRIVASEFLEKTLGREEVNHIDGNKSNNKLKNLEWCTPKENQAHALHTGLMQDQKGSGNFNSKLTENKVLEIRELLKTNMLQKDIATLFNVSRMLITRIKQNEIWKHI